MANVTANRKWYLDIFRPITEHCLKLEGHFGYARAAGAQVAEWLNGSPSLGLFIPGTPWWNTREGGTANVENWRKFFSERNRNSRVGSQLVCFMAVLGAYSCKKYVVAHGKEIRLQFSSLVRFQISLGKLHYFYCSLTDINAELCNTKKPYDVWSIRPVAI